MNLEELCQRIAQRRKELDLSLEEVVEKTKLYPSVIRDIEAGNLDNINSAYRKGFLRIYASFLGIDSSGALDKLPLGVSAQQKSASPAKAQVWPKPLFPIKSLSPKTKKLIVFSLVALFVLWCIISLVSFIAKRMASLPKRAPRQLVRLEKNIAVKTTPQIRTKNKEIIVALTAKRACFVTVKVDGKLLFDAILRKGVVETWRGVKEIELKISDGSAVYLEVNSEPIRSLTASHKPIKSLKITASGIAVVK
jgi:transcriptional regulator with XRE-family HTH domain